MPIYEYRCNSCGHQFEMIQKVSDKPTKQCPKCFKDSAEKLVSAPSFRLKGSGWYETDFKNKSKKPEDKTQTPDKAKPETKKESSKPDKKE